LVEALINNYCISTEFRERLQTKLETIAAQSSHELKPEIAEDIAIAIATNNPDQLVRVFKQHNIPMYSQEAVTVTMTAAIQEALICPEVDTCKVLKYLIDGITEIQWDAYCNEKGDMPVLHFVVAGPNIYKRLEKLELLCKHKSMSYSQLTQRRAYDGKTVIEAAEAENYPERDAIIALLDKHITTKENSISEKVTPGIASAIKLDEPGFIDESLERCGLTPGSDLYTASLIAGYSMAHQVNSIRCFNHIEQLLHQAKLITSHHPSVTIEYTGGAAAGAPAPTPGVGTQLAIDRNALEAEIAQAAALGLADLVQGLSLKDTTDEKPAAAPKDAPLSAKDKAAIESLQATDRLEKLQQQTTSTHAATAAAAKKHRRKKH
jgi:hypothetical protein